ncbi:type VI secretion system baseplate subunit TssG [Mesorhizobium waimense]|uniref:Type VI secretion system baseplate subunit TssG n=1 Tax=Mesorhizobium waimense TaxID=1300307 RepID=A0A3A5KET4_9HYPH|nr:type VI secretion system baseplate subunit TssG [Mesorhizobium waimense]RJT29491.1 type VI secretion system baseplate subunit TssG [Mesorhizobium waimense]
MADDDRPPGDPLIADALGQFLSTVAAEPHGYDFFEALRRVDAICSDRPRLGESGRPSLDRVRIGQEPSLAFPTRPIAGVTDGGETDFVRISTYLFGLFGSNGPLPLHLTEYALLRQQNAADETLVRFADIFHHRMASFFFRAWAESEPTVSHDRPHEDRFALQLASLAGFGMTALLARDAMPDLAKLHFTGRLASHTRNPEGLAAIVASFFEAPVDIREFVPQWVKLPRVSLCLLGLDPRTGRLGCTATAGRRIRVHHHRFRLIVGPLSLVQYESLLPGALGLRTMAQIIRNYIGDELDWEVNLVLRREEMPEVRLGRRGRLGWTSWIGKRKMRRDADDLTTTPPDQRLEQLCPIPP